MWKAAKPPFPKYKKKVFEELAATGKFIYHIGQTDMLRKPSAEVPLEKLSSEEYKAKIKYLKKCLLSYRKISGLGRGVAGVQVGIFERMAVIYMEEVEGKLLVLVNPVIAKVSSSLLSYPEMCMSAAPLVAKVIRPSWVEVVYYDEFGKEQLWNTKDIDKKSRVYNRVLQHEIDHLDGIVNIDYVKSNDLEFALDPHFFRSAQFEEVKV